MLTAITDEGRAVVESATHDLVAGGFGLDVLDDAQLEHVTELLTPLRRAAGDFV